MANPYDIVIRLFAKGGDQVEGEFEDIGRAGKKLESSLDNSARSLDKVQSAFAKSGDQAASDFNDVARAGDKIDDSLRDSAESMTRLSRAADGTDRIATGLDEATRASDRLDDSLEKSVQSMEKMEAAESLSNAGEKMLELGRGAVDLADSWAAVSEEGRGIEQRLESILKAQGKLGDLDTIDDSVQKVTIEGHFDDDDSIRQGAVLLKSFSVETEHVGKMLEMSARQSRTMDKSIESVAEQLGKAYNTGNIAMLAKSGVTMSKNEIAAVKAAYGVSKLAGQMKFMEIVGKAVDANTVSLNDSLSETQKRANDTARAWDDAQTSLGKGSAEAKANFQAIIGQFVELGNANPKLLESAGAMTYYGGQTATAAGSVLTLAGNLGQAVLGAKGLGISGVGSLNAIKGAAGPVLIAVAAIATTIYGAIKLMEGLRDAQMGDDNLKKKHGVWGDIWAEGGKFLGNNKYVGYTPLGIALGNNSFTGQNNGGDDFSGEMGPTKPIKHRATTNPNGSKTYKFEPITINHGKAAGAFG